MPLKDSQRKNFIPNWSLSWYHFPSLMLLVSVRNWGSHTASCVHAHALSCCLEKKEVASCQELLMVCWCGVRLSAIHAVWILVPVFLWLLSSSLFMSTLLWRGNLWPSIQKQSLNACVPLACSYKLHSYVWEGHLTEFSQIKKTLFQGLWKSLRNTLQLSFFHILFIYLFFSIKRIMVVIFRIAFVILSLDIACEFVVTKF